MFLTITTVNNKTYYAFYSTKEECVVLNNLHNEKFIKVIDTKGYKNLLRTSAIVNVLVDDSKDALDNFKKLAGGIN
ncbi:hypothetical protein HIR57_02060 [Staphylococcus coagulans]|uniref:hypothetical protein n=1 Tax=Staphylococcus coagulans TaxID=74706 RepID=UPI001BE8B850|nr:hypothetical protein [Staphylococcus coagulans]MBT2844750.1 hypothetical protein [Staphylococcus coagulans]MBT2850032.1 hypothetical protein [Staphylococcus coagulans]MDU9304432.1 hypothetical protein [Staphylococcus coagulans]MDU9335181.1 hypothetical protein [Staphylococcus coagulans]